MLVSDMASDPAQFLCGECGKGFVESLVVKLLIVGNLVSSTKDIGDMSSPVPQGT